MLYKFSVIHFYMIHKLNLQKDKDMYHSALQEDSVLPRYHHGQHTSHTVAWKCIESTE